MVLEIKPWAVCMLSNMYLCQWAIHLCGAHFELQRLVALNMLHIPQPNYMGLYQFSGQNLCVKATLVPYSFLPPTLPATILCVSKKLATLALQRHGVIVF